MKLLVDAQLAGRIVNWMTAAGCDVIHTTDLPDGNATKDAQVISAAVGGPVPVAFLWGGERHGLGQSLAACYHRFPRRIGPVSWVVGRRSMRMDDLTKLIQAISVAAWPALVFYLVWNYRKQVAAVIESARGRKFVIEIGGQKLSMEEANQQQQNLISDLQSQLLELRKRVEGFQVSPEVSLAKSSPVAQTSNAILWVDDNPKNNSFFIDQLQKSGYRVDLALSTKEGLGKVDRNAYRLILSDMGRTEDGQYVGHAGIVLLEELEKRESQIPFVIFCSAQGVRRFHDRVKELGGRAITSSTTELRAVLDELAPALAA